MRINKCRNCNKKKLEFLFSLGNLSFTGKFPKKNTTIKKAPLEIVMCKNCKLIQLAHRFNLKYLYGPDYGYRSNISKTMVVHLKKVVLNDENLFLFKINIDEKINRIATKNLKSIKCLNFKANTKNIIKKGKQYKLYCIIKFLSFIFDLKNCIKLINIETGIKIFMVLAKS